MNFHIGHKFSFKSQKWFEMTLYHKHLTHPPLNTQVLPFQLPLEICVQIQLLPFCVRASSNSIVEHTLTDTKTLFLWTSICLWRLHCIPCRNHLSLIVKCHWKKFENYIFNHIKHGESDFRSKSNTKNLEIDRMFRDFVIKLYKTKLLWQCVCAVCF